MKALSTLIFVLIIGFSAQANDLQVQPEVMVKIEALAEVKLNKEVKKENTAVARLYRRANSRVKKELAFATKRTRAKLA